MSSATAASNLTMFDESALCMASFRVLKVVLLAHVCVCAITSLPHRSLCDMCDTLTVADSYSFTIFNTVVVWEEEIMVVSPYTGPGPYLAAGGCAIPQSVR